MTWNIKYTLNRVKRIGIALSVGFPLINMVDEYIKNIKNNRGGIANFVIANYRLEEGVEKVKILGDEFADKNKDRMYMIIYGK